MPAALVAGDSFRCAIAVDNARDIADLDINLDLMPDKECTVIRLGLTGSLTDHRPGRAGCLSGVIMTMPPRKAVTVPTTANVSNAAGACNINGLMRMIR